MTKLTVRDLQVELDRKAIVHNIDLEVSVGQWICIIGPNGAGKSSLLKALDDLNAIIATLIARAMESQTDPEKIYTVGLNTSRCLMAVGDIITAWLLLRQADIALVKIPNAGKDLEFYNGKIASAKFFVGNYLPQIAADRKIVEATDNSIMNISDAAF